MSKSNFILFWLGALFMGIGVGYHLRVPDKPCQVNVGGPGGGLMGGKNIINIPEGTKYVVVEVGSAGGAGRPGGDVQAIEWGAP